MIKNVLHSNISKIIATFLLLISSGRCKDENNTVVPYVPVHIELNLTSELANLGVGQLVTITPDTLNEGYGIVDYHNKKINKTRISWKVRGNGILLYRKEFTTYQAFDLTCTYKAYTDYCAIKVEGMEYLPTCPCCQSVFLIQADGYPSNKSKATAALLQYQVNLMNNETSIVISN